MKKLVLYTLIAIVLNIVSILLFSLPLFTASGDGAIGGLIIVFILTCLSLLTQAIVGLVFLNNEKKKEIGQAMLLCVGIFTLIGFSICGRN